MAYDQSTRNRLQKFVSEARAILTEAFTRQLQATYGMDPKNGTIAPVAALHFLSNQGRETAFILRETLAHYLAATPGKSEKERTRQALDRIIREQAFTVLNRLSALRMAEARGFLIESIAKGYRSKGFQLYKNLAGTALGETDDAYCQYLFSLFDEFSLELAVLFDRHSAQGRLFPGEAALLALLEQINHSEIEPLWAEDETIGWIYQYFNSPEERKKMRAESQAPRNSRELAVRNQFFTPRYVVEFLTDNTLGRIWYEMTQGKTALVDSCRYLVRRPTEIFLAKGEAAPEESGEPPESLSQEELLKQPVYIPFRPLKDPREILMLDPACGSMHFGLYAFDLFEKIYEEAWHLETELGPDAFERSAERKPLPASYDSFDAFRKAIPKLIIEQNIHGVDIDPRAVQIAGLSLWLRAQRAWHQMGVKPDQRPPIKKSNVVCAEPMPGEKELLQEFTARLNPPVLGELVEIIFDKMELAGEAGTLLKIEAEIKSAISHKKADFEKELALKKKDESYLPGLAPERNFKLVTDEQLLSADFWETAEERILAALREYADQAESSNGQKRMFAEDAAKGFAFIDICRKRFDVVLMNPPFGSPTINNAISRHLSSTSNNNLYAAFIEIGIARLCGAGFIGAITDRTFMLLPTYERFRKIILDHGLVGLIDLNWGVLDDAQVATSAYIVSNYTYNNIDSWFIDARDLKDKSQILIDINVKYENIKLIQQKILRNIPTIPFSHWAPQHVREAFSSYQPLEDTFAIVRKGLSPGDSERFVKLFCEIPKDRLGINNHWAPYSNGGSFSPYFRQIKEVVNWKDNGYEIRAFCTPEGKPRYVIRSESLYGNAGITFGKRGEVLNLQIVDEGCVFSNEGYIIKLVEGVNRNSILAYLNSNISQYLVNMICGLHKEVGAVKKIPIPKSVAIDSALASKSKELVKISSELNKSEMRGQSTVPLSNLGVDKLLIWLQDVVAQRKKLKLTMQKIAKEVDDYCFYLLKLSACEVKIIKEEIESLRPDWKVELALTEEGVCNELISNYFGYLTGWLRTQDLSINNHNIIDNDTVVFEIKNLLLKQFEKDDLSISTLLSKFGVTTLAEFLRKPVCFFEYHLSVFAKGSRKTPIYWPLQTPSTSYTLWIYYHGLTEQSLYTCVNDFVEPKLKTVADNLNGLRNKSARSSAEEKEFSRLSDLEAELKDFREELLRIAKFWKPNLNDGVQITAAPLWKLFQHKQWQKKLKETWEKLERGDYDWAYLAYSIWPERVLRKCHQDRSLAIAHEVEADFWEAVAVPGEKGQTKTVWQPKKLNEEQLNELIRGKIEAVKFTG